MGFLRLQIKLKIHLRDTVCRWLVIAQIGPVGCTVARGEFSSHQDLNSMISVWIKRIAQPDHNRTG